MRRILATAAGALLTLAGAVAADTPEEAALRAKLTDYVNSKHGFKLPPYAGELDAVYDRADWRAFYAAYNKAYASAKTPEDHFLRMNWELMRLYNGGGFVIAKLYAVETWNMALTYEKSGAPTAAGMKTRAFSNTLYAIALIASDSPMCKDMSAPQNRMVEYQYQAKDLIRFGRALAPDEKKRAIDFALRLERMIAPLRRNDDALCRGGNDESMAALAQASDKDFENAKDGARDPLRPGKTKIITVKGEYHPQYKPDAEWKKTRDEVRPTLQQKLEKLLQPEK